MYNYESDKVSDPVFAAKYKQAERRVQAKLGFYSHLSTYVVINALLIGIYLLTGPLPGNYNYPWFVWPMFGWGIGLLFHYAGVFVFRGSRAPDYRKQMIEAEMRRMGQANETSDFYRRNSPTNGDSVPQSKRPFDQY